MKRFILAACLLAFAVSAQAATTLVFKGYSTASTAQTICTYAMGVATVEGAFQPLLLGVADLGTGKSTAAVGITLQKLVDYDIKCVLKSTGVAQPAKVSFDNYSRSRYVAGSAFTFRIR